MAESIRDQMVKKGVVSKDDTPEAKRAAAHAAEPDIVEKAFPPPFEAPARGVIVESKNRAPATRQCVECGATLSPSRDGKLRLCAECAANA
jgi:hypothetical protein